MNSSLTNANNNKCIPTPFTPLKLNRGPILKNRLALAPLTTTQSHDDGTISDNEYQWLISQARAGYGLVTTCASHVQKKGQGFKGQMACYSDDHIEGLTRLATGLREAGTVSSLQLHHAGIRAMDSISDKAGPSQDSQNQGRALSSKEILTLIDDFVLAAKRAETAGFDGVQIHGAHGYIITQFLSPEVNQRTDDWGGSLANRARLLFRIIDGIRNACGPNFQIGLRISTERFGLQLSEMIDLVQILFKEEKIDYLDLSLWDVTKEAEDPHHQGRPLISLFTELNRRSVRLTVAGNILTGNDVQNALVSGADFVMIGRAAIVVNNFPKQLETTPEFSIPSLPVTQQYLYNQGLRGEFLNYLNGFSRLCSG